MPNQDSLKRFGLKSSPYGYGSKLNHQTNLRFWSMFPLSASHLGVSLFLTTAISLKPNPTNLHPGSVGSGFSRRSPC